MSKDEKDQPWNGRLDERMSNEPSLEEAGFNQIWAGAFGFMLGQLFEGVGFEGSKKFCVSILEGLEEERKKNQS